MYTRHGHQIPGTPYIPRDMGMAVARCGGFTLCKECREDYAKHAPVETAGHSVVDADGRSFDFQLKAKINVVEWYNANVANFPALTTDRVFVVWFSKNLQNWKACLGTVNEDNMYFEVTYNGDKKELYLDAYSKLANVRISDDIFNP